MISKNYYDSFTDAQFAEMSKEVRVLPSNLRDETRERIALFRSVLEITGCATLGEAFAELKRLKGIAHGNVNAN